MRTLIFIPLLLTACRSDQTLIADRVAADLTLDLSSPAYGEFMGDAPVLVQGVVYPRQAVVTVEGERVDVAEDGSFSVELAVDGPYRNIDVEAVIDDQEQYRLVPVFSGHDPVETWPGGLTGRLLPQGLAKLGEGLGATIDDLGWADQLAAVLPSYESDWIDLVPVGITYSPTVVELEPAEDGIATAITLNDVTLEYEIRLDWLSYSEPMTIGFAEVAIGALATPWLDDDGIVWLSLSDARVDMDDADFEFGALEGWVVEWILDGVNGWIIEPLGELIADLVLDQLGTLELGGPFEFQTDLMGTSMDLRLSDLFSDLDGVGAELGLGLGESASTGPLGIPAPGVDTPYAQDADLAIGLHEGLFQSLMGDLVLDFLHQDIELSGSFGEMIGAGVRSLPGGDQVPETDGWCLSIDPGTAYVARMQEGISPLAVVYLPDVTVDIGTMDGSSCDTWLLTSMVFEIALDVEDGTEIGIDLDAPEGHIWQYGAQDVDEEQVVEDLGNWIGGIIGLLGGSLGIDLADLVGGGTAGLPLGELAPSIVGSTPLYNDDGTWIEGLYSVALNLWAE